MGPVQAAPHTPLVAVHPSLPPESSLTGLCIFLSLLRLPCPCGEAPRPPHPTSCLPTLTWTMDSGVPGYGGVLACHVLPGLPETGAHPALGAREGEVQLVGQAGRAGLVRWGAGETLGNMPGPGRTWTNLLVWGAGLGSRGVQVTRASRGRGGGGLGESALWEEGERVSTGQRGGRAGMGVAMEARGSPVSGPGWPRKSRGGAPGTDRDAGVPAWLSGAVEVRAGVLRDSPWRTRACRGQKPGRAGCTEGALRSQVWAEGTVGSGSGGSEVEGWAGGLQAS